ncbi:MAG: sugar transferase [Planctomycetota bacterium]|jgi:exopolysaccharide biosynthesis polyprenyl glycosylphosphotransferase|nr:sugar transferase [Planctomycetota bacterium]
MLAARLKNIFFSLLVIEMLGCSASFMGWCYHIHLHDNIAAYDTNITVFFLIAIFFIAVVFFFILFFQKILRFSSFTTSVSWGGFLDAQILLAALGLAFAGIAWFNGIVGAPTVMLGFSGVAMAIIMALHLVVSTLLRKSYNHPRNKLRILVVGMNNRTRAFCGVLQTTIHLGAELRGYLDEDQVENAPIPHVGKPEQLGDTLRDKVVDVVFIFLPVRTFYDTIENVIETCGFYGVTSYIVGNVFESDTIKKQPLCINDFGNMAFSGTTVDYVGMAVKRVADVIMATIGLIVLSPIVAAIAAYIKIVSPGPVFFIQERIGFNKRAFRMVKFRTMIRDAEQRLSEFAHLNEMDGAAFKITRDPRLICGGAFLRRHSLDELPQLWNVIKGDMSVVGPRPLSRRDFDMLTEDWQRKRFSMRPGMTCIWQVSGRNDVSFIEWMQMDLQYIDRWSPALDFWLVLMTIKVVIVGSGK